MLSHVEFYRKLDKMLAKIDILTEKEDFMISIIQQLEDTFGLSLHFQNGLLYEEGATQFYILDNSICESKSYHAPALLPLESEAVQLLIKHNCYIYDNPKISVAPEIQERGVYTIPGGILIQGNEKRWIILFEITSGWIREEIEFCFNIVRRAIEYRIFSNAFQTNLESAARIQQSLLPRKAPRFPGYQMAARMEPAELVGGDLFDFFDFDSNTFGVSIGDAVGHELHAALLVRDVVTGLRMGIEKEMKITYAFQKLNRVLHRSIYSSAYVTLFYAEIEQQGNMFYVNAGHPAAVLIHGDEHQMLAATGTVIGPLPEFRITRSYNYLPPGAILVLYTDGIFERRNKVGDYFSIERLIRIVTENQNLSADEILATLFQSALEFGNMQPWEDDVTLVIIKRLSD